AQLFAQETPGMPGPQLLEQDRFGFSLAAADFNGDGYADLAIGVPGLSAAIVLDGSSRHLTVRHAQYVPGVGPHVGGHLDPIGVSVAGADFDGSGAADLVLGEPFTSTSQQWAGAIELHPGSPNGLTEPTLGTAELLSMDSSDMAGGPSSI